MNRLWILGIAGVLAGGVYALTSQRKPLGPIGFEDGRSKPIQIKLSSAKDPYLVQLRTQYKLDTVIEGATTDLEKVKRMCKWVQSRWSHVGESKTKPSDPIAILEAAEKGEKFRCVEYGITVAGCLSAVGIPARVVGAQSKDVETRPFGAGHVFAEAYLPTEKKWVFVDAQVGLVGERDGRPLSAVEFRQALSDSSFEVKYPGVLSFCMHYFTYQLDQSFPVSGRQTGVAFLVPVGSAVPTKFQRNPISTPAFSSSRVADFYAPPKPN